MPSPASKLILNVAGVVGRRQDFACLMPHPVAVKAGGRDVRIAVAAAFPARMEMFGGDLQQAGSFEAEPVTGSEDFDVLEPHRLAAVAAAPALADGFPVTDDLNRAHGILASTKWSKRMRRGHSSWDRPSIGSLLARAGQHRLGATPQFVSGQSRLLLETEGAGSPDGRSVEVNSLDPRGKIIAVPAA